MSKIRVGIIRGGEGDHYENSLQKGGEVITHILENLSHKYQPLDVLIDKDGVWHVGGHPVLPADLMHKVDVVWNTTRSQNINQIIKDLSIPDVSVSPFLNLLETNKEVLKEHLKDIGINMPASIILPIFQEDIDISLEKYAFQKAKNVLEKFHGPWIVKPLARDHDMGIRVAKTFEELLKAIGDGAAHRAGMIVEELISGHSVSTHSIAGFRGSDIYTFPVGRLAPEQKEKLISSAEKIFDKTHAGYYLKSDFILHPKKGLYLMKIEFLPDVSKDSHFSLACEGVGAKTHHALEHILSNASSS